MGTSMSYSTWQNHLAQHFDKICSCSPAFRYFPQNRRNVGGFKRIQPLTWLVARTSTPSYPSCEKVASDWTAEQLAVPLTAVAGCVQVCPCPSSILAGACVVMGMR